MFNCYCVFLTKTHVVYPFAFIKIVDFLNFKAASVFTTLVTARKDFLKKDKIPLISD